VGIGLQGAYGVAGGQQSLEELVADRLRQTLLKQQEEQRQFENNLNERKFGENTRQFDAGLGLDRDKLGENARQFDTSHGLDVQKWGDLAPQRAADVDQTTAQTLNSRRQPEKEAADRSHETGLVDRRGTWSLREIGASGAQQRMTQQAQHGFERAMAGGGGSPRLTPTMQADIADMATLEQMSTAAETLGDRTNWDGVGGLMGGTRDQLLMKHTGRGTQESETLRNTITNITATIAKLRGGTSFTANEQKLLESYAPTINDHPNVIRAKLAGLRQFIQMKRQNTLAVAGGNFGALGDNQAQINPGTMGQINNDPLGLRGGK
jgi:hypothetical protein